MEFSGSTWSEWYEQLLAACVPFTVLVVIAILIGGAVQIIPTVIINKAANIEGVRQIPYTPLELAGRDIYVREGCYVCHSQQIRTLVGDVLRYGPYSKLGESIYDHPFQWGSKRTGPDLAREGGKYPNDWHYKHMMKPRDVTAGSIMPNYPWLFTQKTDVAALPSKLHVQRILGVPYPDMKPDAIHRAVAVQQQTIVDSLKEKEIAVEPDREIVALIAYLQKLGKSEIVKKETPEAVHTAAQ
jgi:cytochrome c oxidase cbb3-type subunit I/II